MKIALTILCSLMFVLGQAAALSAPAGGVGQPMKNCGCGGKMKCCQQKDSVPQPLAAIAPTNSQNQFSSPVTTMVVWVLAPAGTSSVTPTVSPLSQAAVAPIFTRNCAWLI